MVLNGPESASRIRPHFSFYVVEEHCDLCIDCRVGAVGRDAAFALDFRTVLVYHFFIWVLDLSGPSGWTARFFFCDSSYLALFGRTTNPSAPLGGNCVSRTFQVRVGP
jgi:hypothetical protein